MLSSTLLCSETDIRGNFVTCTKFLHNDRMTSWQIWYRRTNLIFEIVSQSFELLVLLEERRQSLPIPSLHSLIRYSWELISNSKDNYVKHLLLKVSIKSYLYQSNVPRIVIKTTFRHLYFCVKVMKFSTDKYLQLPCPKINLKFLKTLVFRVDDQFVIEKKSIQLQIQLKISVRSRF